MEINVSKNCILDVQYKKLKFISATLKINGEEIRVFPQECIDKYEESVSKFAFKNITLTEENHKLKRLLEKSKEVLNEKDQRIAVLEGEIEARKALQKINGE